MPNLIYRCLLGRFYTVAPTMTRVQLAASLSALSQLGFAYDGALALQVLAELQAQQQQVQQQQQSSSSSSSSELNRTIHHSSQSQQQKIVLAESTEDGEVLIEEHEKEIDERTLNRRRHEQDANLDGQRKSERQQIDEASPDQETPLEDPDGTHRRRAPLSNDDDVVDQILPPGNEESLDSNREELVNTNTNISDNSDNSDSNEAVAADSQNLVHAVTIEVPHVRRIGDDKFLASTFLEDLPHLRENNQGAISVAVGASSSSTSSVSPSSSSATPPFSYKSAAPANIWTCLKGWESGLLAIGNNLPNPFYGATYSEEAPGPDVKPVRCSARSSGGDGIMMTTSTEFFLDIFSDIMSKPNPTRSEFLLSQQLALASALCAPMLEGSLTNLLVSRRGRQLTEKICNSFAAAPSSSSTSEFSYKSLISDHDFFLSWQDEPSAIHENVRLLQTLTATPFIQRQQSARNLQLVQGGLIANIKGYLNQYLSQAENYSSSSPSAAALPSAFAIPDASWIIPLCVLTAGVTQMPNSAATTGESPVMMVDLSNTLTKYAVEFLLAKGLVLEDDPCLRLVLFSLELRNHLHHQTHHGKNTNNNNINVLNDNDSTLKETIEGLQTRGLLPSLADDEKETFELLATKTEMLDPLLLVINELQQLLVLLEKANTIQQQQQQPASSSDLNNINNNINIEQLLAACTQLCDRLLLRSATSTSSSSLVHPSLLLKAAINHAPHVTSAENVYLRHLIELSNDHQQQQHCNSKHLMMFANPNAVSEFSKTIDLDLPSVSSLLQSLISGNVKTMVMWLPLALQHIQAAAPSTLPEQNERRVAALLNAIDTCLASWFVCAPRKLTDAFRRSLFQDENAPSICSQIFFALPLTSTICLQEFVVTFAGTSSDMASQRYASTIEKIVEEICTFPPSSSSSATDRRSSSTGNNILALIDLAASTISSSACAASLDPSSAEKMIRLLQQKFGNTLFSSLNIQLALKSLAARSGLDEHHVQAQQQRQEEKDKEKQDEETASQNQNQLQTSSAAISYAEKIKIVAADPSHHHQQQQQQQQQNQSSSETGEAAAATTQEQQQQQQQEHQQHQQEQQEEITPENLAAHLEVSAGPLRDRLALLVVLAEHMPDRISSLLHPISVDRLLQEASLIYGFGTLRNRSSSFSSSSSSNSSSSSSRQKVSLYEYEFALGCLVRICSGMSQAVGFETNALINSTANGEFTASGSSSSSSSSTSNVEAAQRDHFLYPAVQSITSVICEECGDVDALSCYGTLSLIRVLAQLDSSAEKIGDLYGCCLDLVVAEEEGGSDQKSKARKMPKLFSERNVEGVIAPGFLLPPLQIFVSLFRSVLVHSRKFSRQEWHQVLRVAGFAQSVQRSTNSAALVASPSVQRSFHQLVTSLLKQETFVRIEEELSESKRNGTNCNNNSNNSNNNNNQISVVSRACKLLARAASLFDGNPDSVSASFSTTSAASTYQHQLDSIISKIAILRPPSTSFTPFPKSVLDKQTTKSSLLINALCNGRNNNNNNSNSAFMNQEFEGILSLLATVRVARHSRNSNQLRIWRNRIFGPLATSELLNKALASPHLKSMVNSNNNNHNNNNIDNNTSNESSSSSFILVKNILLAADTAQQHVTALNFATEWISQRSFSESQLQAHQQQPTVDEPSSTASSCSSSSSFPSSSFAFDQDFFPFLPNLLTFLRTFIESNLYISCHDPEVTSAGERLIAKLIDVQLEALHGAELFDVVAFTLTLHCASKLNTIQALDASAIGDALERYVEAARYRIDCIPVAIVALSRLCPTALTPEHLEALLSPLVALLNSTYLLKTEVGVFKFWWGNVAPNGMMNLPSTVAEEFLSELVFALARIPSAGAFDVALDLPPAVLGSGESTTEEHQLAQLLPKPSSSSNGANNPQQQSQVQEEKEEVPANNANAASLQSRVNVMALIRELADIAVEHSNRFVSGRAIARLMRGLSSFRLLNRDIYRVFSSRLKIRPILNSMERSDVSLTCSAFAQGKFLDEKLFRKMAERICFQIDDYNAADVVLCLRAFNTLHLQNDAVYDSLFGRAIQIAPTLSATSCVEVLTILAHQGAEANIANRTCNRLTETILNQLEEASSSSPSSSSSTTPPAPSLSSDEIVKVLVAFAAIDYSDMDQSQKLVEKLLENFSSLSGEGLQTVCALMIDRNWRDDEVLAAVSSHALKLHTTGLLTPLGARCVLDASSYFLFYDDVLRQTLTESARTVSRDVPPPDDADAEKLTNSSKEDVVGAIEE